MKHSFRWMRARRGTMGLVLAVLALGAGSEATADEDWQLGLRGIGPVRFGMHVYDAARAIGVPLERSTFGRECYYVRPVGGPGGIGFMISEGRVARVDIWQGSVSTLSGARVGDREADVLRRYSGRLKVSRDKYSAGNTLAYVPKDAADQSFRVVFETDGSAVKKVKAGLLPEISWDDGCTK